MSRVLMLAPFLMLNNLEIFEQVKLVLVCNLWLRCAHLQEPELWASSGAMPL